MQEDLAGPAVAPVGELLDSKPHTDGDGVPAGQGGVEQLRPGELRLVLSYIPACAQHPGWGSGRQEGQQKETDIVNRHVFNLDHFGL